MDNCKKMSKTHFVERKPRAIHPHKGNKTKNEESESELPWRVNSHRELLKLIVNSERRGRPIH